MTVEATLNVKVFVNNDTILCFPFADFASVTEPFGVLTAAIAAKVELSTISEVIYEDASGDLITAKNDDDIKWAFEQAKSLHHANTYPKLNVYLEKHLFRRRHSTDHVKSEYFSDNHDIKSNDSDIGDYSPKNLGQKAKSRRKPVSKTCTSSTKSEKGSAFREAAIEVLKKTRSPMTAREIAIFAMDHGILKNAGKTPYATMSAMLYHRVKVEGEGSPFRVWRNLNKFGLKCIVYDKEFDELNENPLKRKLEEQEQSNNKEARTENSLVSVDHEMKEQKHIESDAIAS